MNLLESLRLFVLIVEDGSLSSVARARGVAPSTVTLALQRLEERAQTALINRTTRRMSLTPEGERLFDEARRILDEVDGLFDTLATGGPLSGAVRVTTTNDLGRSQIAPFVGAFIANHPRVRVHLTLTDGVIDLVQEGFDVGIRTGPLQDSQLKTRLLVRGGRRVCASPDYWRERGRPRHPRDLADHNCMVLARPNALQNSWRFREEGREFTVKVDGDRTANDGEVLRAWACDGHGAVLKVDWDIVEDIRAGRLETALDDFTIDDVNLYAVYPAGAGPAPRVSAYLDHLSEHFSAMQARPDTKTREG